MNWRPENIDEHQWVDEGKAEAGWSSEHGMSGRIEAQCSGVRGILVVNECKLHDPYPSVQSVDRAHMTAIHVMQQKATIFGWHVLSSRMGSRSPRRTLLALI